MIEIHLLGPLDVPTTGYTLCGLSLGVNVIAELDDVTCQACLTHNRTPKDPDPPPMPARPLGAVKNPNPTTAPDRPKPYNFALNDTVYIRMHDQLIAAGLEFEHWDGDWIGYQFVDGQDGVLDHAIHHEHMGSKQKIITIGHHQDHPDYYILAGTGDYKWPVWAFMDIDERIERLKEEVAKTDAKSTMQIPAHTCPACCGDLFCNASHLSTANDARWECKVCGAQFEIGVSEDHSHFTVGKRCDLTGDGEKEPGTVQELAKDLEEAEKEESIELDKVKMQLTGDTLDCPRPSYYGAEHIDWTIPKRCPTDGCACVLGVYGERDSLAAPHRSSLHVSESGRPCFVRNYTKSPYLVVQRYCCGCGHAEAERLYDDGRREQL